MNNTTHPDQGTQRVADIARMIAPPMKDLFLKCADAGIPIGLSVSKGECPRAEDAPDDAADAS